MKCLEVRNIEPGSAIDCPPCDPNDPRQRFGHQKLCHSHVLELLLIFHQSVGSLMDIEEKREHKKNKKNRKKLFRWQLDGHGGEEGTLVVEAFPKLCLVAGQDMVEVDFHISYLSRFCISCRDFACLVEILHFPSIRQGLSL